MDERPQSDNVQKGDGAHPGGGSAGPLPSYRELATRTDGAPPGTAWGVFGAADELGTINLLLKRGAPLEAQNVYEGTVLGQAQWCAENNDNGAAYAPIIAALVAAGAKPVSAKRWRGGRAKS